MFWLFYTTDTATQPLTIMMQTIVSQDRKTDRYTNRQTPTTAAATVQIKEQL